MRGDATTTQYRRKSTPIFVWIAIGLISLGTLAYFVMVWLVEYVMRTSSPEGEMRGVGPRSAAGLLRGLPLQPLYRNAQTDGRMTRLIRS